MIANFFRSLDRHGVEYLLISGQATVLYGAATFSEDIDLWLSPTHENSARFLAALRECSAHYYKLTPALTVENLAGVMAFTSFWRLVMSRTLSWISWALRPVSVRLHQPQLRRVRWTANGVPFLPSAYALWSS